MLFSATSRQPVSMASTLQRGTKACEACRKRKVKCNGLVRCQQCSHHGLQCTYSSANKTSRAETRQRGLVLSEFRTPVVQAGPKTLLPNVSARNQDALRDLQSLLNLDLDELVSLYASNVYPTHPVIDAEELKECIARMNDDCDIAAFVYAAAATCLHHAPATASDGYDQGRSRRIDALIDKSASCLGPLTRQTSVSMRCIVARVFLANCLVAVEDPKTAFLYLRQAASMLETYRLSAQVDTGQCDPKLVRLYWLIFVHERYQCIAEYRSALLKPLAPPQDSRFDPMADHVGFSRVVSLFSLLDDLFIQHWLSEAGREPITAAWVRGKCQQFAQDEHDTAVLTSTISLAQQVDLLVTRHWLLALVWRIAMANKLLHEAPPEDCLSLLYPLHVSQRLQRLLQDMPSQAVQIHGIAIVQKLFELADTVADICTHVPTSLLLELDDRLEHLRQLWQMFSLYPQLDATRKGILDGKFRRVFSDGSPEDLSTPLSAVSQPRSV